MSLSKVPIYPPQVKPRDAVPYWEDPDYIRRLSNVHVQALELIEGERETREEEACRQRQKQHENWKVFEGMLGKDPRSLFRHPSLGESVRGEKCRSFSSVLFLPFHV